jgi:glyoxylase-like metal-dependent hydrolase (beta-lactamase superfamily II)
VLLPYLRSIGVRPGDVSHVVVSHADVDHSGGLGAVERWAPGVRTLAHHADRALVEDVEVMLERRYRELRHPYGLDQSPEFVAWVRAAADDGTVTDPVGDDGATIDLGGRSLELVHAPGHTAGHLVARDSATGAEIVADAVLGPVALGLDGQPVFAPTYRFVAPYRRTLARPAAALLLTTHFPVLRDDAVAEFVAASAAAVDAIEDALLATLAADAGLTAPELLAGCAARVRSWPPAADGTLAQPLVGHLEDLEARRMVRRVGSAPPRWRLVA